jgi:hypothetical protein
MFKTALKMLLVAGIAASTFGLGVTWERKVLSKTRISAARNGFRSVGDGVKIRTTPVGTGKPCAPCEEKKKAAASVKPIKFASTVTQDQPCLPRLWPYFNLSQFLQFGSCIYLDGEDAVDAYTALIAMNTKCTSGTGDPCHICLAYEIDVYVPETGTWIPYSNNCIEIPISCGVTVFTELTIDYFSFPTGNYMLSANAYNSDCAGRSSATLIGVPCDGAVSFSSP